MFDLDMFYSDAGRTVIADRPNDFMLWEAVASVEEDINNFSESATKHWVTKMWQWFDVYRQWEKGDKTSTMFPQPLLTDIEKEISNYFRESFKSVRMKSVQDLKVEVDGMIFDGDELSRFRMTTAIVAATDDQETVNWTLADNTKVAVTRLQLKQALKESGRMMEAIWFQG